jgi:hypothetical protein
VKSRFNFKLVEFFTYPFDGGLMKIVEETFNRNYYEPQYNQKFMEVLRYKQVANWLKKYHDAKFGIKWFVDLFSIMFCFFKPEALMAHMNADTLSDYLLDC